MQIIKNAGWGELCKMNEKQFTNQMLLRFLTTNTLTNSGHSDTVRNGNAVRIGTIPASAIVEDAFTLNKKENASTWFEEEVVKN